MSRTARATAGYALGVLLAAVGAGLAWGIGYGLFVLGSVVAVSFLTLYDVDKDADDKVGEGDQ